MGITVSSTAKSGATADMRIKLVRANGVTIDFGKVSNIPVLRDIQQFLVDKRIGDYREAVGFARKQNADGSNSPLELPEGKLARWYQSRRLARLRKEFGIS